MESCSCGVHDPQLLAEIEIGLGVKLSVAGQPEPALKHLANGQAAYNALAESQRDQWWVAKLHDTFANAHVDNFEFDKALEHSFSAVESYRVTGHDQEMRRVLLNIGYVMIQVGAVDKAIEYIIRAADGADDYPGVIATGLGLMGMAYQLVNDLDQANIYYEQSSQTAETLDRKLVFLAEAVSCRIASGEIHLADHLISEAAAIRADHSLHAYTHVAILLAHATVEAEHREYEEARRYCDEAASLLVESDNPLEEARVQMQRAQILFLEENFVDCQEVLERLIDRSLPVVLNMTAGKLLGDLYAETGQWEKAYRLATELGDKTLFEQSQLRSIEQLYDAQVHERNLEERNDKIVALGAERDELFRIVFHDLKTPLSSIKLSAEVLKDRSDRLTTDQLEQCYERISDQLGSVFGVISQMTALAEAESESSPPEFGTIAVDGVIEAVVAKHRFIAESRDQQLIIEDTEQVKMAGVELWLRQIMSNLVSNAIKYSLPGARSRVGVRVDPSGQSFTITVADEGMGFSDHDLERAFSKYGRLSSTPSSDEPSLGLGLYIVQTVAAKMGGTTWITSQGKDLGSILSLRFPTLHDASPFSLQAPADGNL